MDNNTNLDIDKSLFVLSENDFKDADKITTESLSFWQDAWRTLKSNKVVFTSMIIIPILLVLSILFTLTSKYEYDESVDTVDYDYSLAQVKSLPPKIPVIEYLGIFDGEAVVKVSKAQLDTYDEENYTVKSEFEEAGQTMYKIKLDVYKQREVEEYYFFGTDNDGFNMWTKVWMGLLISISIGLFAAVMDLTLGIIYGGIAGYFGGRTDTIMMRIAEVIGGIPSLVILIFMQLILGGGFLSLIIAISATSWIGVARLVRAQIIKLKDQEFVLAAKTVGASDKRIIKRHLLPNILGQLAVIITFSVPAAIFYEAFLSFIGLGLADMPSIGSLVNSGKSTLASDSNLFLLFIPSFFIVFLMLCFNLFANGLRDALDPRMKGE